MAVEQIFQIPRGTAATDMLVNGPISTGSVVKLGSGILTFEGTNNYTSAAINAGTLVINGIEAALFFVNSGILKGTGTINNTVTVNGGTIQPGNSIGTIHLDALVLNPGGTTAIEIDPTTSSMIDVTGMATLNGTLSVTANAGTYPASNTYTILTAANIMGTFGTISLPPAVVDYSINYGATFVELSLIFNSGINSGINIDALAAIDCGSGAISLAKYLNLFNTNPALQPILTNLSNLTPEEQCAALNRISPLSNAGARYMAENTAFALANAISYRASSNRFLRNMQMQKPAFATLYFADQHKLFAQAEPLHQDPLLSDEVSSDATESEPSIPYGSTETLAKENDQHAIWIQTLGDWSHQDAQNGVPSFNANTLGILGGTDYYAENGQLTLLAGYTGTTIHQAQNVGKNEINGYDLGLYGTAYLNNGYLELGVLGAYNRYHNRRQVSFPGFNATAKSSCSGWQIVPHVEGGYDFTFCWGSIEPFASVDCAISYQDSFSEKGAGVFNMHQKSAWSELLRSEVGMNAYQVWHKNWGYIILRETASYVNKQPFGVGEITASLVGFPSDFSVNSFKENQSLFSPAIELFMKKKQLYLSLIYNGEFGSGYVSNEVLGKFGVYF